VQYLAPAALSLAYKAGVQRASAQYQRFGGVPPKILFSFFAAAGGEL